MKSPILKEIKDDWKLSDIKDPAQWADERRILTRTTSAEPGPWRTDRTPYARFPMECFSAPNIRMIVLKFSTQSAKSEIQLNMLGYILDITGGAVLHVLPTTDVLEKFSRTRIKPMINACPSLREKKHPNPDLFQTREMHFQDAIWYGATANSAADLKSTPIETVFCDEVGSFGQFAGKDADPIKLASERQKSFMFTRKMVLVSSPTTENGLITRYHRDCDLRYKFFVACPHCDGMQLLTFEQIKWPNLGDTTEQSTRLKIKRAATYECAHCQKAIDDNHKPAMLRKGEWQAEENTPFEDVESVGFHLNSLYSPFLSWGDIAYEFLDSKDDIGRLQNFRNGWLAEEWKQSISVKKTAEILKCKTDLPPLTVPQEAVAITCGIDVQKYSFFYTVRAWKRDMTSWLIRYGECNRWDEINKIIFEDTYPVVDSDKTMGIWRAFIDTGGTTGSEGVSMTEETYSWLREYGRGIAFGVKGQTWKSAERVKFSIIDKMPGRSGQFIPGGLRLFLVNTDQLKDALHYRIGIEKGEPGAWYLHEDVGEEYARHIISEEKRVHRNGKIEWHAKGENHWLDAEIYCMAAADPQTAGGVRVLSKPVYVPQKRVRPPKRYQQRPQARRQTYVRPNWLDR
jgi:phage terminase large subunit GpA-like protein